MRMWSRKLARTPLAKDVHCAAMKACFRCDASEHIGYGHLMRCLTIADAARPSMASDFAMAHSDHRARDLVLHRGHNVIDLSGAMEFESTNLGPHLINSQVVIFDLSHGLDMSRRANLKCYVNETAKSEVLCILIDGMAPHAAVIESGWNVDILVVPYVGAPEHVEDYDTLSGPHFSVLPLEFGTLNETRQIADKARKILVTFGGSDPLGLSVLAIDSLTALDMPDTHIKVIIGPGFADDLVDQIKHKAAHQPQINLVMAPNSLAAHMVWADLAISATGLTKYELARTGTPAILISIDTAHATSHQAFADANTAWHLGIAEGVSEEPLSRALRDLIDDTDMRKEMSRNGQALIDGLGATRIIDHMKGRQHVEPIVSH